VDRAARSRRASGDEKEPEFPHHAAKAEDQILNIDSIKQPVVSGVITLEELLPAHLLDRQTMEQLISKARAAATTCFHEQFYRVP